MEVTFHLINGHALTVYGLTRHQHERITRTLNRAELPTEPFVTQIEGERVEIPWRSITYVTSKE